MEQEYLTVERKELWYAGIVLLLSVLTVNALLFGGLNLVFAVGFLALTVTAGIYLRRSQKRFSAYNVCLLVLSLVIVAGFVRSNDGFVKNILLMFVLLAVSMAFSVAAGKNPGGGKDVRSLGRAMRLPLSYGLGGMIRSLGGLFGTLRNGKGKNLLGVLIGLLIAVPVLLILVPLLIRADAAFDGMMALFPELELTELFPTVFFGVFVAMAAFSFGVNLVRDQQEQESRESSFRGVGAVTVCTVLVLVCGVYVLYLVSQLAYLSGGLAGILPQDFTLAQYARRGFFEMALLCLVNLTVMVGSVALIRKDGGIPGLCRWLCGFVGLVTLFFVVSSAAKMGLYIQGYGLTRLRILTLVITLFLGLCAVTVTVWLFVNRLPYMKVILVAALAIGAAVLWVDVDAVAASYNVNAYMRGKLDYVDVEYLGGLSDSAVPYIRQLTQAQDQQVAQKAQTVLEEREIYYQDLRGWNYASWKAGQIIERYEKREGSKIV